MSRRSFDARKAIWLAAACVQTYKQYEHPDDEFVVPAGYTVDSGFIAHSLNRVWEPFGFILESSEEIVVAFRGTSSASDWLSDALASQIEYPYAKNAGKAHRGFTEIYQTARDQILTSLRGMSSGKALYVTGHSLGGALAVLCALDVAGNTGFRSPILYTYGAPRVGSPAFVTAFSRRQIAVQRVSNLYDAVTYLPPPTVRIPRTDLVFEYRHIKPFVALEFRGGNVSSNHVIGSYFAELSKRDPAYAKKLCEENPGFCPAQ
ncbi:lipase family protein [Cohnella lubricantis]|uniref:Lipase family protein n=1 Tax=Cohnella lubricantis TaxID=2163172 RepID=A0A841TBG7_9BACL|nr:lipase family protein [Cohnella lubricantis]MBB6677446.1 lipase family protein [Cohnella lubricantis]MBP2116668.1 putative lipase [Cohnella lubricantis]